MRRKGLWLGLLATAMIAGNASAGFVIDGNFDTDWFTYAGSTPLTDPDWNHTQANNTLLNPDILSTDSPHGVRSGAGGGQLYDVEQIFYYGEGDNLYIGLVTGFGPAGENGGGGVNLGHYLAGDLFIGAGDGNYLYAVGLGSEGGGDRQGDVWFANALTTLPTLSVHLDGSPLPDFRPFADPFRVDETNTDITFHNQFAEVAVEQHGGQHWFYEVKINVGQDFYTSGLSLHWTMQCGNDYINVLRTDFTPKDPPVVPVPAAAPMVLLGMGAIGLARRFRRNKQN